MTTRTQSRFKKFIAGGLLACLILPVPATFADENANDGATDPAKRAIAVKCLDSLIYANTLLSDNFTTVREQASAESIEEIAHRFDIDPSEVSITHVADPEGLLGCAEIGLRQSHIDMLILAMSGHDYPLGKAVIDACGKALLSILILSDKAGRGFFDTISETKEVSQLLVTRYSEQNLLFTTMNPSEQKQSALKSFLDVTIAANNGISTITDNLENGFVNDILQCHFIGIDPQGYLFAFMDLAENRQSR